MIKVYDDFFSSNIQQEILHNLGRKSWTFTGGGGYEGYDTSQSNFWHIDELHQEEYYSKYLYDIICKNLNIEISGFNRIYCNGQTASQSGVPHTDDGDITFLYYPNPIWKIHWDGHLMFLDGDEIIKSVSIPFVLFL